ncbi:hypothetical protein L210DRAFT_3524878 [Boletus edulis BED1]|uniref:F-box domain-containing protein n=1 Tax=Boletus edulis BED1 TaxID=1328754 RepID=A0AAD4C753_BOLED|nr:hypothetical protein L210DRAFT_3524878 [Boletus edulis BED1]
MYAYLIAECGHSVSLRTMSDPNTLSFNQFPPEILHRISKYIDVPDILRLRRVRESPLAM